jgi:hypothetical protein
MFIILHRREWPKHESRLNTSLCSSEVCPLTVWLDRLEGKKDKKEELASVTMPISLQEGGWLTYERELPATFALVILLS